MPHVRERDDEPDRPARPVIGGTVTDDPETSLAAREAETAADDEVLESGAAPQVDADLAGESDVPVIGRVVDDDPGLQDAERQQPPDDDS